jgi:hypothetical protein
LGAKKAVLTIGLMLLAASLACTNPITSYLSTQTAVMETATATLWTPTPTLTPTPTSTPTVTNTPTATFTPTLDPRYYFETEGRVNFSYIPPDGWKKITVDGTDLRGWKGPGKTQIGFFDMKSSDWAADAATELASQLEPLFTNYKEEGSGTLDLDSGVDNSWLAFSGSLQANKVFITIYTFADGENTIVYAMYVRTPDANEDQDEVVLDSMITFRFDE